MNVQELRIGNLVHFENNNLNLEVRIIEGVGKDRISLLVKGCTFSQMVYHGRERVRWITPIPLNKEWLIKFGFKKRGDLIFCKNRKSCFDLDPERMEFSHKDYPLTNLVKQTKYVHQLQNLYFALTGEELTIDLK